MSFEYFGLLAYAFASKAQLIINLTVFLLIRIRMSLTLPAQIFIEFAQPLEIVARNGLKEDNSIN